MLNKVDRDLYIGAYSPFSNEHRGMYIDLKCTLISHEMKYHSTCYNKVYDTDSKLYICACDLLIDCAILQNNDAI